MIEKLIGLAWLAPFVAVAWIGIAIHDRFTTRGRLVAAYTRALAKHGEGSPEATAAHAALMEHWRNLDRC
jgi:hypothetical protein